MPPALFAFGPQASAWRHEAFVAGAKRGQMADSGVPAIVVGIIMGSKSDWETMEPARATLNELGIACEMRVVSAHRMPEEMFAYARSAMERGLKAIIAGAGGAAHLPGMTAAKTLVPVIGVPIQSKALHGIDSLLSIAQMPPGVPVATMAIGGAANAALFAARIVALEDAEVAARLAEYVARMHDAAASSTPE
jgi:5-(carboxyamino)imidazole ribonucleotide mutase